MPQAATRTRMSEGAELWNSNLGFLKWLAELHEADRFHRINARSRLNVRFRSRSFVLVLMLVSYSDSSIQDQILSVRSEEPLREEHSHRHRGHEDQGFDSERAEIGERWPGAEAAQPPADAENCGASY